MLFCLLLKMLKGVAKSYSCLLSQLIFLGDDWCGTITLFTTFSYFTSSKVGYGTSICHIITIAINMRFSKLL